MKILNFGSLNIDRVFQVEHIVRPGETIASNSLTVFAGGKGANQSVALARAGARVAHAGKIGADGRWLLEKLQAESIDVRHVLASDGPTGQAIIQVARDGQNSIVLLGGSNREITPDEVDRAIGDCVPGDWLLVQNETSSVDHAIRAAKQRGLRVAFNPAPCDLRVANFPWQSVDLLCLNETEGAVLSDKQNAAGMLEVLSAAMPHGEVVLTLGADGARYAGPGGPVAVAAYPVDAIDTTAAGDTFLGYYLAARCRELDPQASLQLATRAAALCVTRHGAMDSIPRAAEVEQFTVTRS